MKTYNSRDVFYLDLRGRRQQIQRYAWSNIGSESTAVLEIRPGTGSGMIRQIRMAVPGVTDFDAIFSQSLDTTTGMAYNVDVVESYTNENETLIDTAVDWFFHSDKKSMKNEKETMNYDSTLGTEAVILLSLLANAGVFTNITAEILIEGDFAIQNPRPLVKRRSDPNG